jgi:hypothetical protein
MLIFSLVVGVAVKCFFGNSSISRFDNLKLSADFHAAL